MIIINSISATKFTIDGIEYFKNFMPIVRGNTISIINIYDSKVDLSGAKVFDQYNVNGIVYGTIEDTQSALLPALFSRDISGGTTIWGDITGDINNQADLINLVNNTGVQSVVAGDNITVDNTDPNNPIVSGENGGVQSIVAGTNVTVDNTDPDNPIVSSTGGTTPTIQEVLTQGNEVDVDTDIIFNGLTPDVVSTIRNSETILSLSRSSNNSISALNLSDNDFSYGFFKLVNNIPTRINVVSLGEDELFLSASGSESINFKGIVGSSGYAANYASIDNAYTQVGFVYGFVEKESITGTKNIDWVRYQTVGNYTLTGATTLTESNLRTRVLEFVITGDFALTLPSTWTAYPSNDAYDGTQYNHIVVTCIDNTLSSEIVFYTLTNLPI
jgi:hypothetical protein